MMPPHRKHDADLHRLYHAIKYQAPKTIIWSWNTLFEIFLATGHHDAKKQLEGTIPRDRAIIAFTGSPQRQELLGPPCPPGAIQQHQQFHQLRMLQRAYFLHIAIHIL